ncbi:hypothetical protein ES702_02280 [subsurface metagenome]
MNKMLQNRLFFRNGYLQEFFEKIKKDIRNEVESKDSNYILNVEDKNFCEYLISKYSLEIPKIYEDDIETYEPEEVNIDVSKAPGRDIYYRNGPQYEKGVKIKIAIPFKGNGDLFKYKPSRYTLHHNPPRGEITEQEIHLIYKMVKHNDKEFREMFKRHLSNIKEYLECYRKDIENFNDSLRQFVTKFVSTRKKKLSKDKDPVESLGFRIRRRKDLSETYKIPPARRKPKFVLPKVKNKLVEQEEILELEEYENILNIINNMALGMEKSPKAYSKFQEEEIRNQFLVALNIQYEGQATGETFNYGGRTDIIINYMNKNIFIAECKFWGGEKKLCKTIDQLLRYTSWRDTKTAIILLNKNKNFSSVIKKIDPAVKNHPCYKRVRKLKSNKLKSETIFSYIFHHTQDIEREMILTVMAFDVPRINN